jgi:hypothetical protein
VDYLRVKIATDARRQLMKLWSSTTNELQRSRWGDIGSPVGEKMSIIRIMSLLVIVSTALINNSAMVKKLYIA